MSIKVMSQNVQSWQKDEIEGSQFELRRPLMERAIKDSDADVIGFQEVIPRWEEYFKEDLAEYEYILVYRAQSNLEATPIYWKKDKLKALDKGHFWLSETPDRESLGWDGKCYRIACWVLFEEKATGKKFAFVNTHLDHRGEAARQNGIQLVCDFISDKFGKDMPIVLTGDFNALPDSETIKKANSLLTDARKAAKETTDFPTFHGYTGLTNIIDYIYLGGNIECTRFDIVAKQDGKAFQADHYGILAEIVL